MASRKFIEILKTKNGRITSVTTDLVKDSDLSVSDITTNNVTSTAHGFAPKSVADATQFLNSAATPTYAQVKDSDLSTSDVTTNNVSITKHGFAPKAPNDASKFLDGTGNYSAPSGSLPDPVTVPHGGTGLTTLTAVALLAGNGTSPVSLVGVNAAGNLLIDQGPGNVPIFTAVTGDWTITALGVATLKNTGTAGTYTSVTTDAQGRVTAGTNPSVRGLIDGLILSDNGAGSSQLNYAAGTCRDDTDAFSLVLAAGNKLISPSPFVAGSGNAGLDTGTIAINTWYHVWVISKAAGASPDVLTSLSATAPTMPATYTLKRRIGAFRTDGASKVTRFVQNHDLFTWLVPVLDVNAANPGTAAVLRTLTVPTGVKVQAQINVGFSAATPATDNPGGVLFTDPATTDTAPSVTAATILNYSVASNGLNPAPTMTNTSAQVRSRIQISTAGTTLFVLTFGWLDPRGKDI